MAVNAAQIRSALERHIGGSIPDGVWDLLVDRDYVADFLQRHLTLKGLAREAITLLAYADTVRARPLGRPGRRGSRRRASGQKHDGRVRIQVDPLSRDQALSVLVAADVDRDPRVQEFRNRVLGGRLLRRRTAREWIEQRARRRKLSALARRLADETGWTLGQAALYLLTDDVPYLPAFEQTYVYRRRSGASRVIMTVDPARSPGEVAETYARLRRRIVGQRHRDLTEKHLWLAMFAAARSREESLAVQMAAWNKSFPTWKYESPSTFGRDRLQARRRILHPAFAAEVGDYDFYRKLGYGAGDAEQLAKLDLEELLLSGEDTMIPRRRFA